MRASVYDWMRQTPEHEQYGREIYPTVHSLAVSHNTFNDFARSVQSLPRQNYLQYQAEHDQWMNTYGRNWMSMGCLREIRVGQRSTGRTVYGGRTRGSLAGIGALAGSYFRTPSYPRNAISGFGAVSDRPPLPSGYSMHSTPPESSLTWLGDWEAVPGFWNWTRRRATGPKGTCYIYMNASLTDSFMAVPGGTVSMSSADVKALQAALNSTYLSPKSYVLLKVDGILGPKTCGALHWYQYEIHGTDSATISPYTYMHLNLPLRFGQEYPNICTKHYTGDYSGIPGQGEPTPFVPDPIPDPVPDPIPDPPPPSRAGLGIAAGVILGLTALGAFVFSKKRKGKKGKK